MRNMMRAIIILAALSGAVLAGETAKHAFKPKSGYVPDAKTAIAVAIWGPIYHPVSQRGSSVLASWQARPWG